MARWAFSMSSDDEYVSCLLESENTWKKVQGVINGLLQIFDGVTSVISTINQLREGIGGLSQDSAKSEKEKAAAQLVSTGAQLANMAPTAGAGFSIPRSLSSGATTSGLFDAPAYSPNRPNVGP